jgi:hypothetical protein
VISHRADRCLTRLWGFQHGRESRRAFVCPAGRVLDREPDDCRLRHRSLRQSEPVRRERHFDAFAIGKPRR